MFLDPGGTPLLFLVEDEATLLHAGDALNVKLKINPDIFCQLILIFQVLKQIKEN